MHFHPQTNRKHVFIVIRQRIPEEQFTNEQNDFKWFSIQWIPVMTAGRMSRNELLLLKLHSELTTKTDFIFSNARNSRQIESARNLALVMFAHIQSRKCGRSVCADFTFCGRSICFALGRKQMGNLLAFLRQWMEHIF